LAQWLAWQRRQTKFIAVIFFLLFPRFHRIFYREIKKKRKHRTTTKEPTSIKIPAILSAVFNFLFICFWILRQ